MSGPTWTLEFSTREALLLLAAVVANAVLLSFVVRGCGSTGGEGAADVLEDMANKLEEDGELRAGEGLNHKRRADSLEVELDAVLIERDRARWSLQDRSFNARRADQIADEALDDFDAGTGTCEDALAPCTAARDSLRGVIASARQLEALSDSALVTSERRGEACCASAVSYRSAYVASDSALGFQRQASDHLRGEISTLRWQRRGLLTGICGTLAYGLTQDPKIAAAAAGACGGFSLFGL